MLRIWNRDLQSCFHMLTDLLNPKGSHGCDDFLMTFIKDFVVKYLPDSINLFDKDFNLIKYLFMMLVLLNQKGGVLM